MIKATINKSIKDYILQLNRIKTLRCGRAKMDAAVVYTRRWRENNDIEDEERADVLGSRIATRMKRQTSDHNYSFLHVAVVRHTFHLTSHPAGRQWIKAEHYRDRIVRAIEFKLGALSPFFAKNELAALRSVERGFLSCSIIFPFADRNPSPFQPQRSPYPPSSAFLSPWRFYGNGASTKSSGISGETKLLVDERERERARRRQIEGRKDERGERRSPRANGGYIDQKEKQRCNCEWKQAGERARHHEKGRHQERWYRWLRRGKLCRRDISCWRTVQPHGPSNRESEHIPDRNVLQSYRKRQWPRSTMYVLQGGC